MTTSPLTFRLTLMCRNATGRTRPNRPPPSIEGEGDGKSGQVLDSDSAANDAEMFRDSGHVIAHK